MKRILKFVFVVLLFICCSCRPMPNTQVTIRVVDEQGNPVEGAKVGLAFEVLGGTNRKVYERITAKDGLFTATNKSTGSATFSVDKEGYYSSLGGFHFSKSDSKWQPWNPEERVILRKIGKPVPMYARKTNFSDLYLPSTDKKIGFDLMEYDWVKPYEKGVTPDLYFRVHNEFDSERKFTSILTVTFNNKFDGIQEVDNEFKHSLFKMPRFAPEQGYKREIRLERSNINMGYDSGKFYVFRVRSVVKDGKLVRAMYGKIHGDIMHNPGLKKTALITMQYYLNPDYTTNLEFDPKRNLVVGAKSVELLSAP